MFIFELGLLVLACILLILFIVFMDRLCAPIPEEHNPIDWPEGHALYTYERRHWRAKRHNTQ